MRGSSWSHNVRQESWAAFEKYLKEAKTILEAAAAKRPDRPEAFSHLITVGKGLSLSTPQRRAWFDQAKKADPSFFYAYENFMDSIKQRWGGSDGEVKSFAQASVASAPAHSRMPMLIVSMHVELSESTQSGAAWFAKPQVWKELDQAFQTQEKNQDGYLSSYDRTNWTRWAIACGDTKRALEQLDKLGIYAHYAYETERDSGYGRWPNLGAFLKDRTAVLNANGQATSFEAQQAWFFAGLSETIARKPDFINLRQSRAFAYRDAGRFEEAMVDLEFLAQQDPKNTDNDYFMGTIALQSLNDPARAIKHYDRVLAAFPTAYRTQRDKAIALVRLDRNDEALAVIKKMMQESPDRASELTPLVNGYAPSHKFEAGLSHLPVIISLTPVTGENEFILVRSCLALSACMETMTQYKGALDTMQKAVDLFPNNYYANVELSRQLISGLDPALRDYPRGIKYGEHALPLADQPDYALAYMLGKAYELTKQPAEAIAMYQLVLRLKPDMAEAQTRISEVKAGRLRTE